MRDQFADVAALAEVDLATSPDAYSEAMRAAYWEDKDLAGAIAIGWAGISRLLAEAHRAQEDRALELHGRAKALAYDLASFTWPGWDEAGIVVTPAETRAGFTAARANLGFAMELDKGALPTSRAHWLLGAHQLAAHLDADARASFEQSITQAESAGDPGRSEAGLARAFRSLVDVRTGAATEATLEAELAALAALDDGPVYVEQVRAARRVFEI